MSLLFHCPVPSQLTLRLRPCQLGAIPAIERGMFGYAVTYLSSNANADLRRPHFWQAYGPGPSGFYVRFALLPLPDVRQRLGQIAIPGQGVEG